MCLVCAKRFVIYGERKNIKTKQEKGAGGYSWVGGRKAKCGEDQAKQERDSRDQN